ncbi:unnamed protein product [Calypogeia fissa]
MAVTLNSGRQQPAYLPEFLYAPRSAIFAEAQSRNGSIAINSVAAGALFRENDFNYVRRHGSNVKTSRLEQHDRNLAAENGQFKSTMIYSPKEPSAGAAIQMYSGQFYAACAFGGVLACGLTHAAMTPLDVVKCNMQIDPAKYDSTIGAFRTVVREQGARSLLRGWAPTLLGYSAQGACKYGFYEYFKKYYTDMVGLEEAKKHKTLIYLAGSASAEFIADIALCPFEAVKVRVQTQPGFARGLADGVPKILRQEGMRGLYKGILPLWGRQVPYAMMKFASFESTVEAIYEHVVPKPKDECSTLEQLGVSFLGGYIAGVACAVISHPADNLVSFLNNSEGATISEAVRKMGGMAIFTRGLPLRILMIGTLSGAQWIIYDAFKLSVGLSTTAGIQMAEPSSAAAGDITSTTGISKGNLVDVLQQEIKQ